MAMVVAAVIVEQRFKRAGQPDYVTVRFINNGAAVGRR
jgi:hypothetical protein